jgi:hypothetical protein
LQVLSWASADTAFFSHSDATVYHFERNLLLLRFDCLYAVKRIPAFAAMTTRKGRRPGT